MKKISLMFLLSLGYMSGYCQSDDFNSYVESKSYEKYNIEGNKKVELKDFVGAIELFDKAIKLVPDGISGYLNRGYAKILSHDLQSALTDYNTAIKLQPDDPTAYFYRGIIECRSGQRDAGCTDISKAGDLGHPKEKVSEAKSRFCN